LHKRFVHLSCRMLWPFGIYTSLFEITAAGVFLRKTPIHYGYSGLHRIRKRYSGRPKLLRPGTCNRLTWAIFFSVCFALYGPTAAAGQVTEPGIKGPPVQRSLFAEYSNDSSHMLLGIARERKLVTLGGSYSVRFLSSRHVSIAYYAEFRPLILESDPILEKTCFEFQGAPPGLVNTCLRWKTPSPVLSTSPNPYSIQFVDPNGSVPPFTEVITNTYGRRWNYATGLSPIGYDLKLMPSHRWHPVLTGLVGFLVATRDLPLQKTSNFNFTFEFGAGIEHRIAPGKAWRVEYRYHHISNDYIGAQNPGIDSGVLHVGYIFGR
jgi:Lipid A 3-O-deacylase (PagL)